ncbi:Glycosyltransferase family 10 (fucosyltransferase) C-term [Mucilaginibacter pineti]|uniref:Glycosyltransferase family 10 (Fucosyltransferase) C-term n=1 Tax=Mucilaginibacter pineti TaxID=1391627 RepID=A0A1G6ZLN7_9SPHI|nr:glycosyltransferase family 10 [Mucilaginibacter pineti]SDE03724.1 Glycosyltransferase family 10 (fucosyltransferase) C-term [Mucilaginibacter pineti]
MQQVKKVIKIKFQNGLSFGIGVREVFSCVSDYYEFLDSDDPDFIIFGPYGNDLPPKSDRYVRIGYYCENIAPDFSLCEWAFGMPLEEEVRHPNYKKIQWHNLDPAELLKNNPDIDRIISTKTRFCNFLYGHKVPYREAFFRALSKYKKVDAPGRSMNNMPSIDNLFQGDIWERKRQFLAPYKFTISFENNSYPGYQTEKLYDAMLEWSIPIYCGDPYITDLFNPDSFINGFDILNADYGVLTRALEKTTQMDFKDFRPGVFHNMPDHIKRKIKIIGRELKMRVQFNGLKYDKLVDKIVELDENEGLYRQMLLEPWFKNNKVPSNTLAVTRWKEIFG